MQMKEHCDTFQGELDQLTNTVSMLSDTKVNMTDFNSLLSDVSDLRETVSTKADNDTVLDLTEDMHRVREYISCLSLNFTKQIGHINKTLSTKADQRDVDLLTEKVTSRSTKTVTTNVIETLEDIVQGWINIKEHPISHGIQIILSVSRFMS